MLESIYDLEPRLVHPASAARGHVDESVPAEIAEDFREAANVLSISPKASAALARRCLQAILIDKGADEKKTLQKQIEEMQSTFPSHLEQFVDHIRERGNKAAHPIVSGHTGEIEEVEPNEADWLLELIEALFDHYYAKPRLYEERARALQEKGTANPAGEDNGAT